MAEATQLGRALDGGVVTHWPDKGGPDGSGFRQCPRTVSMRGSLPAIAAAALFVDGFSEQH